MADFNLSLQMDDVNVLSDAIRTGTGTITPRQRNNQCSCFAARRSTSIMKDRGHARNLSRC